MSGFNMPPGVSTRDIPGQDDDECDMQAMAVLTLRDYFATHAMAGLLASYGGIHDADIRQMSVAKWSYVMADAMLEVRNA